MVKNSVLQQSYIQKSKLFLLPLTGVRRDKVFKCMNTYISATNLSCDEYSSGISMKDEILIVTFPKEYRNNRAKMYAKFEKLIESDIILSPWEKFESENLLSNRYFICFHELRDELAYTFDMSKWSSDWRAFLKGRYSMFSEEAKDKIINFRWSSLEPTEQKKLYCYLYPYKEECIKVFSEELEIPIEELMEVKELCSKPNLNLENYIPEKLKKQPEEDLNEIES